MSFTEATASLLRIFMVTGLPQDLMDATGGQGMYYRAKDD